MNLTHDLLTRRLRLTPLTLAHVDAILEWANDPAVTGNSQFFREPSDRKRIARFILELEDDPNCAYYAAFVRDDCDERAVGYVGNVFMILTVASRNDRVKVALLPLLYGVPTDATGLFLRQILHRPTGRRSLSGAAAGGRSGLLPAAQADPG